MLIKEVPKLKNYITTAELAEALKVSRQTLYDWRKKGLPFIKIGSRIRFDLEAVNEWINEQNN
jgi:excisionase family DNA binding protein